MYIHVGKGKYWKVLLYAAVAGLIGAIIENFTLAYICQKSQHDNHTKVFTFFIEEFFWVICEYSIPYLNLIKMEALSTEKMVKIIKIIIVVLFIPFAGARLYDGYDRMMEGYLNTPFSRKCHGIAFGIMTISDIICTIFIIYFVKNKNKNNSFGSNNVISYIKNSSYTILIAVDIVSMILSILYIISTLFPENSDLESSTIIFHCFKSVFILILSTDALIFKYEVNGSSTNQRSTSASSKGKDYDSYKNSKSSNKRTGNYSNDIVISNFGSNGNSNAQINFSSSNYPSTEGEYFNRSNTYSNNKPITINYFNVSPSSLEEGKEFQSRQFGFLYQSNDCTDLLYKGNQKNVPEN
ncbi:hypothetical protein H8356DRAFT_1707408 [Neocallimastix lanati (nom. inval.)]|nr:hypothetical protein H8356DRAFT_1707408 [Neocallimastix sp. JGI-2020a]